METAELKRVLYTAGPPPDFIEFRYCPKDPMHWRSDGDRCPACQTKIAVKRYVPVEPTHDPNPEVTINPATPTQPST